MAGLRNKHADMEIGYVQIGTKTQLYIQVGQERQYYGTLMSAKQASGLELRRHIEVSRDWQWNRYSGSGKKRSRWRTGKV